MDEQTKEQAESKPLSKRQLRKIEKANRSKEFWKMKRKEKKERKKLRKEAGEVVVKRKAEDTR